ncbi:MAG TPA: winged helix-turn-helix domain-containing protein [Gammaproteobacteria bacterium]
MHAGARSGELQVSEPHESSVPSSRWSFLSNHAHVLLCLARDPDARMREVAEKVGITERAAMRIVAHLVEVGAVTRTREGRRNHYEVNPTAHLRHPLVAHKTVGVLLAAFLMTSE